MATNVVLICQDLIFTSKITGTAKALGLTIQVVQSTTDALQQASDDTKLVLVDLSLPQAAGFQQLQELRQGLSLRARLIAYGSHVDVEKLRQARAAGCDPVLPRSEFTERLPDILQQAAS